MSLRRPQGLQLPLCRMLHRGSGSPDSGYSVNNSSNLTTIEAMRTNVCFSAHTECLPGLQYNSITGFVIVVFAQLMGFNHAAQDQIQCLQGDQVAHRNPIAQIILAQDSVVSSGRR